MVLMAAGCVAVDEFAPKQRTQIETYLTTQSMEYRVTSDSVYVHLAGNRATQGESQSGVEAEKGDRVRYNFAAYTFTTKPAQQPYYTNKRYLAESISKDLDISLWNFEPREVVLGSGDILNGLDEAFEGSIKGDSLLVFFTSSRAYGASGMGAVEANQAVMITLNVIDVEKR